MRQRKASPYGIERLKLRQYGNRLLMELVDATGTYPIEAGIDHWLPGTSSIPGAELHHGYSLREAPVIAAAHWTAANQLEVEWIYPRSAFRDVLHLTFADAQIRLERRVNINSGIRQWEPLQGMRRVPDSEV